MLDSTTSKKSKIENVAPTKKREWHKPRIIEVFYPREIKSIKDLHNWMNAVDLDGRLSDRDKRILNRLARHLHIKTGRLDPYLDVLALELSIESPSGDINSTRRMIRRSLELAEKLGWIERTQRSAGYRRNLSNSYRLTVPKWDSHSDSTVLVEEKFHTRTPESVPGGLYSPLQPSHTRTRESEKNSEVREQRKKNCVKNLSPPAAANIDSGATDSDSGKGAQEDFQRFWAQYPKKVAKLAAQKAFAQAVKKVAPNVILAGALRYAAERDGQDSKFTKHPATWLNKGCWDDEASPASAPGRSPNRNPGVAALLRMAGGGHE